MVVKGVNQVGLVVAQTEVGMVEDMAEVVKEKMVRREGEMVEEMVKVV